jgi:hypothetical protein
VAAERGSDHPLQGLRRDGAPGMIASTSGPDPMPASQEKPVTQHPSRTPIFAGLTLVALVLAVQGVTLHTLGQPVLCTCGTIRVWVGDVLGPENSQQLTDWYTFSHVIHGMIFYGLGRLVLPRAPLIVALALALGLEAAWEIAENSPVVIDRYRAQALAQGYSGDSVVNSLSDTLAMVVGFVLARRLPVRATVGLALAFEILTASVVRDNLTLNVIQLIHPIEAIGAWQSGLAGTPGG